MYVRLSDTVFTFSGYAKWGVPVETPPPIPEGLLPTESMKLSYPPTEWPSDNRKCSGLSLVSFRLNGMCREAWICSRYLEHDMLGSHGDAYAGIVKGAWSTLDNEPELDLYWGRKSYRDECHTALEFKETVMAWGFNSSMTNSIPTSRFIKLVTMGGRGIGSRAWSEHCACLLTMLDIDPTGDPLEKAHAAFKGPKHLSSLLKVIANVKQMSEHEQRKHYLKNRQQWNQRTKNTSTIY